MGAQLSSSVICQIFSVIEQWEHASSVTLIDTEWKVIRLLENFFKFSGTSFLKCTLIRTSLIFAHPKIKMLSAQNGVVFQIQKFYKQFIHIQLVYNTFSQFAVCKKRNASLIFLVGNEFHGINEVTSFKKMELSERNIRFDISFLHAANC